MLFHIFNMAAILNFVILNFSWSNFSPSGSKFNFKFDVDPLIIVGYITIIEFFVTSSVKSQTTLTNGGLWETTNIYVSPSSLNVKGMSVQDNMLFPPTSRLLHT